jgi:hypothetical protein
MPPSWGGNSILAKNCCSEVFLPQKLAPCNYARKWQR